MVFGNGHIIIIYHNNKIAAQLCHIIQTLQCFAAAQRAVTDHCDYIAVLALQVSCLCKPCRQTNRCGRMPYRKEIMLAFVRIAVAGYVIIFFFIQIRIFSACQHLVRIALMRYVINNFILRGIKYIMQCNRCLYHTKVRAKMTTMLACSNQKCMAHFFRQYR